MKATPIRDLLAAQPVFHGLEPADLDLLAGCARNAVVPAGTLLAQEGDPADGCFVIRRGRLALQLHGPGAPLLLDTVGEGEVVGWSWIFPPYRWTADVQSLERAHIVTIDGRCLRDKADTDPAFGYRLMKQLAQVMAHRLETTRLRLLDLYGTAPGQQ
jgi:CRP-like cAMP-binding protein